jgi:hypothetical protein
MKTKIITMLVAILILASFFTSFAQAELMVNGFNQVVANNETQHSLFITIDDTSDIATAKKSDTNLTIYINHYVNYTFANGDTVTACFFQSQQTKNAYDIDGNLINSTNELQTALYNYSATSLRYYQMRDIDLLQIDLHCFWDSKVNDSVFQYMSQTVIGLGVDMPSYACGDCSRQGYEEIITAYMEAQQTEEDYLQIYVNSTNLTTNITELWLIIYWLISLFLLVLLFGLIFFAGLWMYDFVKRVSASM